MIDHAGRVGRAAAGPRASLVPREPTAQEFFARLASGGALSVVRNGDSAPESALSESDLATVARLVAPLFGDRPLGALTLGELAELPALLESRGMAPDASRAACRALGNALRTAILTLPDSRRTS